MSPRPWATRPEIEIYGVTAAQMAAIEARVFAAGLPVAALMEKAAGLVARRLVDLLGDLARGSAPSLGILAGPGHNGADALVVARELHLAGWTVAVYHPFDRRKDLTAAHARYAQSLGIPVGGESENLAQVLASDAILDGLFGFGLERPITGPAAAAIAQVNARSGSSQPVVALDLPSGLHTDSGAVLGTALRASHTLCLGLWKRGLLLDGALPWLGEAELVDIGLPLADIRAVLGSQPALVRQTAATLRSPLPRSPLVHKYRTGRLLLVVGSERYAGAAILAALGARAGGAGMITVAVPASLKSLLIAQVPEMLVVGCETTALGAIAALPPDLDVSRFDCVVYGCGLDEAAPEVLAACLASPATLLLDADGLNQLAALGATVWPARLAARSAPTLLTPHAGEFDRLFSSHNLPGNLPPLAAGGDRLKAAQAAAQATGAIVLLKGARTLIASPGGQTHVLSASTPALARGGSGDVLAGFAGSWLAGAIGGKFIDRPIDPTFDSINDLAAWLAAAAGFHAQAALALERGRSSLGVEGVSLATALLELPYGTA